MRFANNKRVLIRIGIYLQILVFVALLAFLLSACATKARATDPVEVQVKASEFKFDSPQTEYLTGVPYRFVLVNEGFLAHEWVVSPKGASGHGHRDAVAEIRDDTFVPGATAVKEVSFSRKGEFEFACHLPGHYEAGMVFTVRVV